MESNESATAGTTVEPVEEDIVGYVPRYAVPNLSSLLPSFTNSEQDFIQRTFHTGNYDSIRHLPDDIKYQQVMATRTARMEATRQYLMPALNQPLLKSRPDNQQGLFEVFAYEPSNFSMQDELAAKERVESEAKRMAVGGKEFTPAGTCNLGKHQDFAEGKLFPHLGGEYDSKLEARLTYKAQQAALMLGPAHVSPGSDKLAAEKPTKADTWAMMTNVRQWILKDWPGAELSLFENQEDCWVLRVGIDSIDSLDGMKAYMNVFMRCNELVNSYRLTKVVEFWHTTPEDGGVYYVIRPPWVKPNGLRSFFATAPLEKHWSTSHAVQEVNKGKVLRASDESDDAGGASSGGARVDTVHTALGYSSRLEWGRNFTTGTPATRFQSTVIN